jgi:hypothetical protein
MRSIQNQETRKSISYLICLLIFAASAAFARADEPVHRLEVARQLVSDLQHHAEINVYAVHPTFVHWGHPTRKARTVCGSLVALLLEHIYHWNAETIETWLGAGGEDASTWYKAIIHANGFKQYRNVAQIRPGDYLAIKYNDGSKDTGHIMLVDKEPEHIVATAPLKPGTEQYRVEVIDSSRSGHGPTDTRHKPGGGFTGDIGKGIFRLYVHGDGSIAGYTWSEEALSKFYKKPERTLVIGRLTR